MTCGTTKGKFLFFGRASEPMGRASEPAERAPKPARRASETGGRPRGVGAEEKESKKKKQSVPGMWWYHRSSFPTGPLPKNWNICICFRGRSTQYSSMRATGSASRMGIGSSPAAMGEWKYPCQGPPRGCGSCRRELSMLALFGESLKAAAYKKFML